MCISSTSIFLLQSESVFMKTVVAALAALLLAGCAQANAPDDAADTSRPAPAQAASAAEKALAGSGVEIVGELDAPKGYHGFVGNYRGQQLPVYVMPDEKHLMVGSLYDMEGHDLTSPAMRKVADSGLGAEQWKAMEASSWIVEGDPDAKRVVYVFTDPECPYCHHFWKASQEWLKDGDVQIRNILVAVISPKSLPRSAAILGADDPTVAWQENERNFGKNGDPSGRPSAASREKISANNELMTNLGFYGTPAIVWKDSSGKIHALRGMPPDQETLRALFED